MLCAETTANCTLIGCTEFNQKLFFCLYLEPYGTTYNAILVKQTKNYIKVELPDMPFSIAQTFWENYD